MPAKSPEMLRSQVRRIRWDELFDARHGFMVETQGDDADRGGMAPKQIITQVRESIREVFERRPGGRAGRRSKRAKGSRGWRI